MKKLLIPLALFLALSGFLYVGLFRDPREVPSPLIDKPAPAFSAQSLKDPARSIKREDLLGKVWVLNVWASWCVACREEHPLLVAWNKDNKVLLIGLDYKDQRADGMGWLQQFGNPYTDSLFDPDGNIGFDYGVYGVPETFVIDKTGTVRMKHIGPLTPEALSEKIEPMLRKLNG
jgi:cytochrome c biogenesis protein CcmG, thiol:disulfide interchange protein DsbE